MALPVKKGKKDHYTFADVLTWDEGERIEIINGEAFMMAGPSPRHQDIGGELFAQLHNFLEGKRCKVYSAPMDVRLFERDGDDPKDVDTVVQPDISVICDNSKIDHRGCKGAPDMVIEILSPSTQRHDRLIKLDLYQRAGVREYWIVSPEEETAQVLLRDGDSLKIHEIYGKKDIAKVHVLNGCFIELSKVFTE